MHPLLTRASLLIIALIALAPSLPLSAQEEAPPPAEGTIIVQQVSDIKAVGSWTMLRPNHESFDRTDASLTMPNMIPGRYSFFATPPKGTTATTKVYLGDDVLISSDTQQISFDLKDKMTLTVVVTYDLTIFGKVGVSSDPHGVPFELRGPNGLYEAGVTPAEFPTFPIGNYSVTYKPEGCPQPPATSDLLEKDSRIDFMVQIVCSTLRQVQGNSSSTHVQTDVDGEVVTFNDVPVTAWYAPYIATVVKRNIMSGFTDAAGKSTGMFGPGDPVTIAQLAKITHTMMKLDEKLVTGAPLNRLAIGQWFTRYVASAEENGWLVFVDGTVDPHRPATRGEVVVTFLQALDIPVRWAKGKTFTDVNRRTPWANAIETAATEEIVSGGKDASGNDTGLFHPLDPITRAETAKILIRIREKYQTRETEF